MIETYKIPTGREKVDNGSLFTMAENQHGLRGHSRKLNRTRSRLDIRKHTFSQRVVNGWNRLLQSVVDTKTVNSFKNAWDNTVRKWTLEATEACQSIILQLQVQVHLSRAWSMTKKYPRTA
jgi:hypothetical protein